MARTSNLYQHATSELRLRGILSKADPLPISYAAITLSIIDKFDDYRSKARNVGNTINLVSDLFKRMYLNKVSPDLDDVGIENICRLMSQLPLTSLKGEDAEWATKSSGVSVNKRCPRVMRDETGQAFDTECPTEDGTVVSRPITFPYYPQRKS